MAVLSGLFDPSRVAVVGATDREGSVGRALLENLLADFAGEVVPVNPDRDAVLGEPCVPDLAAAGDVDLAVVAVPPDAALDVTREAGEHGIDHVVVVTAGFGEVGGEGARRERELREIAVEYDLNLVGPNCLGVMSTPEGLNATFAPASALPGSISLLSQSGAFVTAVLDWANDQGIGFKDVVSLGNKAVLDETDFVETWGEDEHTDVILGYVESIEDGAAFVERARDVTEETPIVLVKSGRTDAGAQAASSHTGAIAGSENAYEAGLRKAGVLRADTVQELFDAARVLAGQPLPGANGVAIVTNAGGPGVMTTDAVGDSALDLAAFEDATMEALSAAMPEAASVYNPVDVLGDAGADRFADALDALLADPNVGAVVALACPTAVLEYDALAETVVERAAGQETPVVGCLMGGERVEPAAATLREAGIPNYFDPARAVESLEALAAYRDVTEREREAPMAFDVDRERARGILGRVESREGTRLGVEAMELLAAYGIPIPESEIVTTPGEAVEAAEAIGGAVVMKLVSPDILHKSDIGGVKVGVPIEDVRDAYEDLVARAYNYQPDATILGVQVQEVVDLDAGTETIVGVNRDPQFGPLVLFGLGGIFVEVLGDTTVELAPVTESEARAMTREIESAPLLRGARGRDPADIEAVVETIGRLSQLAADFPALIELDVNPLVATPDGVQAVDVRLTVDPEKL
ncbi:MAG: acetate--CoA ligase family protein [Halobacteriales archaeon]